MKPHLLAVIALAGCCVGSGAVAGAGDVYVPAHRTADGHWVPANVPPSSGGTRPARQLPARSARAPVTAAPAAAATLPPLLVDAQPIRRD